jgi:hypothetical protein
VIPRQYVEHMTAAIANIEALVSPLGGQRERSPSAARQIDCFPLIFAKPLPAGLASPADCALAPVCAFAIVT